MAWRRSGDKPLSEPMMARLPTHICVNELIRFDEKPCGPSISKKVRLIDKHIRIKDWPMFKSGVLVHWPAFLEPECLSMRPDVYGWWRRGCLVTWFCYQLIAKPGKNTATPPLPNPCAVNRTLEMNVFDGRIPLWRIHNLSSINIFVFLSRMLWIPRWQCWMLFNLKIN